MNALRDQAKTKVVETNLPVMKNMRLAPEVFEALREELGDTETWPEFFTRAGIMLASMRRMVRDDLRGVNGLVVRLVGAEPYEASSAPTGVGQPYDRRKPPARAAAR